MVADFFVVGFKDNLSRVKKLGRNKFEVHDTHNNKQMYQTKIGQHLLAGGVDSVVVPYKVASYQCVVAVRVVIDWKTPSAVKFEKVQAQAFGNYYSSFFHKLTKSALSTNY